MNTEDFAFNDGANSQVVEHLAAVLPGVGVAVFALALLVEAVNLRDLS